jgi:transglutaminase-like putative cysteine protease
VLMARKGVCQDFAHLESAALRSPGLPARYISGCSTGWCRRT